MKQVLFVRPDSREGGKIMWCESGSERVEVVDSLEMLSEHPWLRAFVSCYPPAT